MAKTTTFIVWLLRPWRERAEFARAAEDRARELVAAGGREGAMREVRELRYVASADPAAARRAHALQAAIDRLVPAPARSPRYDTATRMLYRDD